MTSHPQGSPAERARQVIGLTSNAWRVSPYKLHPQARRAPAPRCLSQELMRTPGGAVGTHSQTFLA